MFSQLFVSLLLLETVRSQINGEFWWLHEKVAQLQHVEPPAPKFEDVSEFDTDESAKIVFIDSDLNPEENNHRNMSLNEGEISPGFVYFNLAQPVAVEKEVRINKTKTMNKTHEDYKITKQEPIKSDNYVYLAKVKNNTKNLKISVNGEMQPDLIYYKLTKPTPVDVNALINPKNKVYFTNDESVEQFITSGLKNYSERNNRTQKNGDEFRFTFPNNDEYFWDKTNKKMDEKNDDKIVNVTDVKTVFNTSETPNNLISSDKTKHTGKIAISDKIQFDEVKKQTESESICTFITKHECTRNKGIIHMTGLCPKNSIHDFHKICCILPLFGSIEAKLSFAKPNRNNHVKRYKRSEAIEKLNSVLQQRNALLQRKSSSIELKNIHATTTVRTKPVQKIVTPGDYVDPYWNIKNSKFRHQTTPSSPNKDYENSKYDYGKDYSDDYTVEVPKPGLVGFYSDQERLTSWKMKNKAYSYNGYDEVSEEDSGEEDPVPFGYSTFDPRQGERKKITTSRTTKRKPQRLTSTTEEDSSNGHTIHFHSKPDFHVLQGFKLVNLMENKNRFVRKTTTESLCDYNQDTSNDHSFSNVENPDDIYDDTIDLDQQIYNNCGKSLTKSLEMTAEQTYDPWLALVVLTKSPQTIICYATIVHPRAAITAAECVHGKSPGDVTILTGLLNLKKDKEASQHRMASVHINSDYKPGELANDQALLYWKRPFRLEASIQPACLADPHVGDDCYFVGWGGYDQALQHRPNSQQATILTPNSCNEKLSAPEVDLPAGAFCASVTSRGTVTGIGGPLLCKGSGRRVSIVGVAVYRENVVVMLPAFEWVVSALRTHHII